MTDHLANAWTHTCNRILHRGVVATVFAVAACTATPVEDPAPPDDTTAETSQSLDGPLKFCYGFTPNGPGDTRVAVDGETIPQCASWARGHGYNDYQLGCEQTNGVISWGRPFDDPFGVTLPSPNCGWSCVSTTGRHCSTTLICHCSRGTTPYPGIIDCAGDCIFDPDVEGCADACRRAGTGGIPQ